MGRVRPSPGGAGIEHGLFCELACAAALCDNRPCCKGGTVPKVLLQWLERARAMMRAWGLKVL